MSHMENESKLSVGIIGAGWVGQPLAEVLFSAGHNVIATTTSSEKVADIESTGARAELLQLPLNESQSQEPHFVFSQDILIIAIPPQVKHGKTDYPEKIRQIVTRASASGTKRIVMISTTAVYNGLSGEVDETMPLDFDSPKVAILSEAENAVLAFSGNSVVLRLAGLIGPKRHPARFIKSPRLLANGGIAVNLIHLDDVIGLLLASTEPNAPSGIFNGVANTHVSKETFYQAAASAAGEELPVFAKNDASEGSKVILGGKAERELNFNLEHPDLIKWLATEKPQISNDS